VRRKCERRSVVRCPWVCRCALRHQRAQRADQTTTRTDRLSHASHLLLSKHYCFYYRRDRGERLKHNHEGLGDLSGSAYNNSRYAVIEWPQREPNTRPNIAAADRRHTMNWRPVRQRVVTRALLLARLSRVPTSLPRWSCVTAAARAPRPGDRRRPSGSPIDHVLGHKRTAAPDCPVMGIVSPFSAG